MGWASSVSRWGSGGSEQRVWLSLADRMPESEGRRAVTCFHSAADAPGNITTFAMFCLQKAETWERGGLGDDPKSQVIIIMNMPGANGVVHIHFLSLFFKYYCADFTTSGSIDMQQRRTNPNTAVQIGERTSTLSAWGWCVGRCVEGTTRRIARSHRWRRK